MLRKRVGLLTVLLASCASHLSDRASQIRWAESPDQVSGCHFLGMVDGSSMQTGAANISTGRNNARNEALEHAAAKGATHVHWMANDESFGGIRVTAEAYDCSSREEVVAELHDPDTEAVATHHRTETTTKPTAPSKKRAADDLISSGTGFFVSTTGLVLSSLHVVKDLKFIFIVDSLGRASCRKRG